MTVVPLCYLFYKPTEAKRALLAGTIERMQRFYREKMNCLLEHKGWVVMFSVAIVVITLVLAGGMKSELMTADDTGTISIGENSRNRMMQEEFSAIYGAIAVFLIFVVMSAQSDHGLKSSPD